jgi:glycosyltransferase involved in cell wall biosynthesis
MRIAQIIDDLNYGGAEQIVVNLSLGLQRRGHEVVLICLREIGTQPVGLAEARAAGVEFVELHKPEGMHLPTLRKLIRSLRERRVEVVHTHNHLVHHYGAVAGRCVGARAILNTLHGTASLQKSAKWSQWLFFASGLAGHRVVAVCAQVRDTLRDHFRFPSRWIDTVDNGIDLRKYLQIERRQPGADLVFGTIGRLDPIKDHRNLLQAFALLRRRHPTARLRILGDGSLLQDLQSLASTLSLGDSVLFEGFSLNTPAFLEGIDVYVISSLSEGLPLSLLEAMGAGLPIVATSVGEIPDIVRRANCGWLAAPGDAEDLAHAMQEAAQAADLAEKGRQSRMHARDHYTAERMTSNYESLYRELAPESMGAQPSNP